MLSEGLVAGLAFIVMLALPVAGATVTMLGSYGRGFFEATLVSATG